MSEGIDSAAGTKAPVTQAYTTPVYCPVVVEERALQGFMRAPGAGPPPDSTDVQYSSFISWPGKTPAAPAAMPTFRPVTGRGEGRIPHFLL